jgi:hypothetical protein
MAKESPNPGAGHLQYTEAGGKDVSCYGMLLPTKPSREPEGAQFSTRVVCVRRARATCGCLMVSMCPGLEQQFDIAAQMIDAGRSDVGSAFGFREDESTL